MSCHSFEIHVPDATLIDLRQRLETARLLEAGVHDWSAGVSPAYLAQLVEHWRSSYRWRAHEAQLNRWRHFRAEVSGTTLHFIHERGRGDAPLPIVLTHGFPDSFLRFVKLIPLLTDPGAHGADPSDSFDVVVPSLPGYGFSDAIDKSGAAFNYGGLWHELMTEVLGYERFAAHGGDWGSTVTEHLARSHAKSVVGIHLTDVPFWHGFQKPSDPSPAEAEYLAAIERYPVTEGAYAMIQGSRPQTLAASLNDSPVGLAAWLVDKLQRWSDCQGDVETRFTKDELLTHVMLYWVTETISSSFAPYYDIGQAGAARWILEKAKELVHPTHVPAAFARFPKDLSHPPREWAERFFDVQRWTRMPRGGHFAALEEPELLAADIREFFRPLRASATIH